MKYNTNNEIRVKLVDDVAGKIMGHRYIITNQYIYHHNHSNAKETSKLW